ncbi:MAG: hypothetical protein JSW47_07155 [Phycisphaerales bacterium]|nr:MAG: hypothetical protein JSW47_07155 [Phycisphaerales bacterium]
MHEWIFEKSDKQAQEAESPASLKDKDNNIKLAALAERVKNDHQELKESLEQLQSSLNNLRLVTKYRVFDLEATRRENARLKKLLEGDDDREIP